MRAGWKERLVDRVARRIVWAGRFVKGWLPRTLGGASALILILWGAVPEHQWAFPALWLLIVGVAVGILAFFAEVIVQQPSYMKLSELREEAELRAASRSEALERALTILLVRLGVHCGLDAHSDRSSVYYFHEDEFVMVARHAKNPKLAVPGRGRYPANEGAIGAAWDRPEGQALVTMPNADEAWERAALRQGIDPAEVKKLRMRSLSLAGYRLEAGERSVGVLVVESMTARRIDQSHLDTIADSHIAAAIAELVSAFALMTPAGESINAVSTNRESKAWSPVKPRVQIGPAAR